MPATARCIKCGDPKHQHVLQPQPIYCRGCKRKCVYRGPGEEKLG